ncbi:MAG: HNH endonuclease [Pseudomonadota bacterium]|nr:HNH endonuclease [Pseudomonadota bacterium]
MPRYYLKPIFWNTEGYTRPTGVNATSGYPFDHGYGHEEWNNADFMSFTENGEHVRTFHTEGLGNAPVTENAGHIFLFLYASHDRVQQLVGAIGKATYLGFDEHQEERKGLVRRLHIQPKWQDAWELPIVQQRHANNVETFRNSWDADVNWLPNWKCPEALFFWPETPVTLDPMQITGRQQLIRMFSSYMEIGPDAASRVMASVPVETRTDAWSRIRDEIDVSFEDADADVADVLADPHLGATTKQALIDARRGHGKFRAQVMALWDNACAVTGCTQPQVLRASHIIPWKSSSNKERLNPSNGLLLSANLDALFDRGLVSFQTSGEMLVSEQVTQEARKLLGLPANLLRKPAEQDAFLNYHRNKVFWA